MRRRRPGYTFAVTFGAFAILGVLPPGENV